MSKAARRICGIRPLTLETTMSDLQITVKPLPFLRLAALTETVGSQPEVAAKVGPMFDRVADVIVASGGEPGLPVAEYDMNKHGVRIRVGFTYDGPAIEGVDILELPAVESAVTGTHLGAMSTIDQSWHEIQQAIDERGAQPQGACREVYLDSESDDQSTWVTELQQPITERSED
ncbi:GyrI-like domain-containing protein [Microbacterium sp. 3J1]|uniref:GyrI-like domain-containing protein n=1 Tax=Microbacterium sp. 3J1 TaxID=861269 RepID=UPI000B8545F6|nr:GyrI-like domain-containing protein [Microbacterium sp. 3J1]